MFNNIKDNHKYRTHTCGELCKQSVGSRVKLSGWVHRKRNHGGVYFIDLRDHYGITQLVISSERENNSLTQEQHEIMLKLSYETVITVIGTVVKRSDDTINTDIPTGEVEIVVEDFIIESVADPLPLTVNSNQNYPEEIRLEYRFLDLRREEVHNRIMLRSKIIRYIRSKMHELGFNEIQTPILTASSPEGARDFLVPSRLHPGKFYALPQAPQQFKQLLMMSGFDKYFQIAPCFRDEDSRADRAPGEFYQLDMEMSFVTQEDVFKAIEPVMYGVFKEFSNYKVTNPPFPRIPYNQAMLMYGSDKPDLRNNIVISDLTDIFADSQLSIFREAIKSGAVVRAIPAPNTQNKPRSFFDGMISFAQNELGAKGLAYITFDGDNAKGPIAKLLTADQINQIKSRANLQQADSVFFACDSPINAAKIAGKVRTKIGEDLDIIEQNTFRLCWITDFPFYEWNDETNSVIFSHNPFSMPQGGIDALNQADTVEKQLSILAYQYDIACNGIELSSGAIRNHKPEIMYKAFDIAGFPKSEVDEKFGAMIKAMQYGAPPHGGIAPGIDRIIMLLANEPNIREVIAFPLNQRGQDLMMGAPAEVTEKQLKELRIKIY